MKIMKDEIHKKEFIDLISTIKNQAIEAKTPAEKSKKEFDYSQGKIMGYYSIVTLLKHQAFAFCIDQKELGLSDIDPETDLLGLHKNPNIDLGEDNWAIDLMSKKKIKGYLIDSIRILKNQAIEAKRAAENPKDGDEDYNNGEMGAYREVLSTLKKSISLFDLNQEDVGLEDIEPERDLI